jgi:hypothetical protein
MKMMIILKENITRKCHELFLQENRTMNKGVNHPKLGMLVGHLLVDELYLSTMVVVDRLAAAVMGL